MNKRSGGRMIKKTIGSFAHVDAGKTTFSEQLLFHGKAIRKRGRVDHKDAFFDGHAIEKERGITVFSEQGFFTYKDAFYNLVDTPGHVDFSAEMERAVQIMDYAIIIISGMDGVESHTERVYELLEKNKVPIFFFVNKMDTDHSDYKTCLVSIKEMSSHMVDFHDEKLYESLAEKDDLLMALFFKDQFDSNFHNLLSKAIKEQRIMPVFKGSALKDEGIEEFLESLHKYTYIDNINKDLSGLVYKIRHDKRGVRETFIKLNSGHLQVRDQTEFGQITEIRRYQGAKYETIQTMEAGDLCAVIGLCAEVKDGFGEFTPYRFETKPTMMSKVTFDDFKDPRLVYRDLKILEIEDPMLHLEYEKSHKEIKIGIMGEIQLEVLKAVFQERFNYEINFESPSIIYKESLKNSVIGYGHFEPLKHYAEVILKLEPNPKGGLIFESKCSLDDLNQGHQNLIKHHIFEKHHRGILTGSELTDLKITLLTGAAHEKHTSGGDFREASLRALRQGLEHGENLLLEPFLQVIITVAAEYSGKVMTDLSTFHSKSLKIKNISENVEITAYVSVEKIRNYAMELMSFTQGKGRIKTKFYAYQPCENADEIIKNIAYDKDRDVDYPSSSVFCKKGKGYTVTWQEAKNSMHCLHKI
jgi:small GTP-binding protein